MKANNLIFFGNIKSDLQILRYVDRKHPNHDFQADDQMPFKRENEKYAEEESAQKKPEEPPVLEEGPHGQRSPREKRIRQSWR